MAEKIQFYTFDANHDKKITLVEFQNGMNEIWKSYNPEIDFGDPYLGRENLDKFKSKSGLPFRKAIANSMELHGSIFSPLTIKWGLSFQRFVLNAWEEFSGKPVSCYNFNCTGNPISLENAKAKHSDWMAFDCYD